MTLVLNHLRQLNGSKFLFLALTILFLATSCDALKKVPKEKKPDSDLGEIQGQRKYNPKTGKWETTSEVTEAMDTVAWKEPTREVPPPIISDTVGEVAGDDGTVPNSEKLGRYKVAVMLPFLSNKLQSSNNRINEKSMTAINFYGGMKMALDNLSSKGVKLDVTVLDTEGSSTVTKSLLQRPEVTGADILFGPVRKDNLKLVAAFAKENKKPLISPLSPSTTITTDNPYYIQFAPSLKTHCNAITKHVRDRYETDQVVLVTRNKGAETKRMKYFHEANAKYEGTIVAERFQEFVISDLTADLNEVEMEPYFKEGKTTVFIVPSWSNEKFVYSLLRKIRTSKGNNKVVVYGMPQWMDYQRISFDYYEALNVHVSNKIAVDLDAVSTEDFKRNYFYKYGESPSDDAFLGYNIMSYIGSLIAKNGTQFQKTIDQEPGSYPSTKFLFDPVPGTTSNLENLSEIGRYENMHINILEFKDYSFQKSN